MACCISSFVSSAPTQIGIHAGSEPMRQIFADMDFFLREGMMQILCIGVDRDEINATHTALNHVVDGVLTRTSNADDTNPCERFDFRLYLRHRNKDLAIGPLMCRITLPPPPLSMQIRLL